MGVMGKSMVRNLMKAGYELSIYTRTKDKVQDIIEEGAVWRDTVAECVRDRELSSPWWAIPRMFGRFILVRRAS